MTNIELFYLITKPYINTHEIQQISEWGKGKSQKFRAKVETDCEGKISLPYQKIPTSYLLKEIDMKKEDIFKLAKMEKELEEISRNKKGEIK